MRRCFIFSVSMLVFLEILTICYAKDVVKLAPSFSQADKRYDYPETILRKALDATLESDGQYIVAYAPTSMVRNRALTEIITGEQLNVHIAATRNEWEERAIPIRIPILKGLLGYRLFLVHRKDLPKFSGLKDIEDLKKLRAGVGAQWTTTMVLREAGFEVITGTNYEGLFRMLDLNRFDYFPRGVNEIFAEFESRKSLYPDLQIEPTKAMYFPTPSYFFVSPKYPELAERIRKGLQLLILSGVFDKLFEEAYGDAISKANLNKRHIFTFENPLLPAQTPLDQPELWFSP